MIELCRYVLALMVAQTHLWNVGHAWTGNIAVFAFYTLSGYLMTRVLNERYGFTARGTATFLANRVLRLWPAYLILLGLTLITLLFVPLSNYFSLIRMPQSPLEIITNLTIVGQVTFDFVQWLPLAKPLVTSWSLSIEVFCYILLAIYFARTPSRLWAFAAIGLLAMAISTWHCAVSADPARYGPYCSQNRYGVLQAGFIPFAMGGLFYFHKLSISQWINAKWLPVGAMLVVSVIALFMSSTLNVTIAPYLGIIAMFCLLSRWDDRQANSVQDFFGRSSYHLFIAHMPISAVLIVGLHWTANTVAILIGTVAVALVLSAGLVPLERSINVFRQRIVRAQASERAGSGALLPHA
jgi:peptidoglycan/LPS O-acetylase OafA/YrhL